MKKVVIAEDIGAVIKKERSFLDRPDVKVLTASSNTRTLAIHRRERADLLIARMDGPGMDGEALSLKIRSDPALRRVSLIMVCPESEWERCASCLANAFVKSPVEAAVLLEEAHRLLNIAARASLRVPVKVLVRGNSRALPFEARSENLSASGMLIRSGAPLYEGDTVTCSFKLPGSAPLRAEAEVVRAEGDEGGEALYGLSFVDPEDRLGRAVEAALVHPKASAVI